MKYNSSLPTLNVRISIGTRRIKYSKKEIELYKKYENKLNKLEDKLSNQRFIMEFESKYLNLGKRVNKLIEIHRNGSTINLFYFD